MNERADKIKNDTEGDIKRLTSQLEVANGERIRLEAEVAMLKTDLGVARNQIEQLTRELNRRI
jgi:peptidoglycan hydrolase CwlO-like protein